MRSQESSVDKYIYILKRRWLPGLGVFVPVFLIYTAASSLKKPSYLAEGKIQLQRTNTISSLTGVGAEIGKLEPLVQDKSSPLNTEAEILRSDPVVQQTIDRLSLKDNKGASLRAKELIAKLTVNDIQKTDILKVAYSDKNPTKAAKIVNTIMDVYLEHNVTSRRKEAAAARKFLEKQVPTAESVVREAEAELAEFKEKNKVVSLQEEATKAVEIITELQKQINQTQGQIADVNAQSQALGKQLDMSPQQAVAKTSVSQSSGVQDILKEVQQLESQLAARRTVLQDTHPEIINLESKLKSLNAILKQRIKENLGAKKLEKNTQLQMGALQEQLAADLMKLETTSLGLTSQVAALSNLQTSYRQRLNILPRLEQQQRQLERKVQASQSTYSLLLQKLQESRIAENQNLGNASLVSQAQVPDTPISSPMISYLSAGLLGTLAALATIYLLEAKDKSIKTVDEAKELLGLTLLGVIPSFNKSKKSIFGKQETELSLPQLVVRDIPRSPISEAYRMLRANLKFMSADKQLKVIVVTSSVSREGKSTVAANLAVAMAQVGSKVLLVDADMRHPTQHHIWGLTNAVGLSNVMVDITALNEALQEVMPNLDVIPSGVIPPNPFALIDSRLMNILVDTFAEEYDFVIFDTPPLAGTADAATLGQMADGVLLVVRPGVVDVVNAAAACELLEKSGQNVLGQVVNGVILKNEPHSYYYFTKEEDLQQSDTINESVKIVK